MPRGCWFIFVKIFKPYRNLLYDSSVILINILNTVTFNTSEVSATVGEKSQTNKV